MHSQNQFSNMTFYNFLYKLFCKGGILNYIKRYVQNINVMEYKNEKILQQIADNIRFLRKRKGYTHFELAEILDTSLMTISRIENGTAIINVLLLRKISEFFTVPMDDIVNKNLIKRISES